MAEPARPTARRGRGPRRASLGRLAAAWLVVLAAAAAPFAATASDGTTAAGDVALLAPPDETCRATETQAAGGFDICSPPTPGNGGGAGLDIGGLLPILGGVVLGAGLALVAAYLVLRRRAGAPLDPVDAGEWWSCRKCGRNNVVGSARCYGCGSWQG
jgi:hypothetical protein